MSIYNTVKRTGQTIVGIAAGLWTLNTFVLEPAQQKEEQVKEKLEIIAQNTINIATYYQPQTPEQIAKYGKTYFIGKDSVGVLVTDRNNNKIADKYDDIQIFTDQGRNMYMFDGSTAYKWLPRNYQWNDGGREKIDSTLKKIITDEKILDYKFN
mgnify:CR=1 FL=1